MRLLPHVENKINKIADQVFYIEQAYLLRNKGLTVRIRRQRDRKGKTRNIFTTKQRVDGKIIEIEKKISESDYTGLAKVAVGWLTKIRYVVEEWEVDFFKNGLATYFVMAEIEMPDGQDEPDELPIFIEENLIFKVPKEDFRFSSKKLSDVDYATKLLGEIDDDLGRIKAY